MNKELDKEQKRFLYALASWQGMARNRDLRIPADRAQDKARQKLRRRGLVTFDRGYWRWKLTEAGWEAVRDGKSPGELLSFVLTNIR